MSTLEEIQSAAERLPSPEQKVLFQFLAVKLNAKSPPLQPYQTRTHRGSVRPGINADKLGQLPEDF